MVPTSEAVAEALETIPEGAPWPWAALRVMPAIRGTRVPVIDDVELEKFGFEPLSAFPTVEMRPGVDVSFAIEVEVVHVNVDQQHLDRWDMTIDQVAPVAMSNLVRTVGTWKGEVYADTYEGIETRMLRGWPQWALSLILLPEELKRLFGAHDQFFVAPFACNLISLPIDVDRDLAADIVDLFGWVNPRSLLLGLPGFVLRAGELSTAELPGFSDLPDDDVAAQV